MHPLFPFVQKLNVLRFRLESVKDIKDTWGLEVRGFGELNIKLWSNDFADLGCPHFGTSPHEHGVISFQTRIAIHSNTRLGDSSRVKYLDEELAWCPKSCTQLGQCFNSIPTQTGLLKFGETS